MMEEGSFRGRALRALAAVSDAADASLPVRGRVRVEADGSLGVGAMPPRSVIRFSAEGLDFVMELTSGDDQVGCRLAADIGFLPFTVQAPERRRAGLLILRSAQTLPRARFRLVHGQKVVLESNSTLKGRVTAAALFTEALRTIQEARPFLRLLGEFVG